MRTRPNGFFRANLAALRQKDSEAAAAVRSAGPACATVVESFPARTGDPTMRASASPTDHRLLMHSAYDPRAEAAQWADGLDFSCNRAVVLLGFGMGYYAEQILNRLNEDSFALFVERDAVLLKEAMRRRDLRAVFESPKSFFAVGPDPARVLMTFRNLYDPRKEPTPLVLDHVPSTVLFPEFYGSLPEKIRDDFLWLVKHVRTIVSLSPMWHGNALCNLADAADAPGVLPLKGLFKDRPAIIVAAGPSLNKNIHLLRKAAGAALIVAVGTALKPLQRHGIRPHLAVTVDGSYKTYPQFQGVDLDGIHLITNLSAYPKVVEAFPNRCFMWDMGNPLMDWLGEINGERGELAVGGTVSITAMDVAALCGCNPILTVGLDMAFTDDGHTHAADTIHAKCQVDVNALRKVPGNYAETVPTNNIFYTYLRAVERYVASRPDIEFINCTAGGARIEGCHILGLEEAIARHCVAPFEAFGEIAHAWEAGRPGNVEKVLHEISGILKDFRRVERLARTAASLCNELVFHCKVVYDDTEEAALALLKRLERIDAGILAKEKHQSLISLVMKPIFYSMETRVTDDEKSYSKAIRTHIRSRKMYEGFLAASVWTRRMLKEARRKIRKRYNGPGLELPAGTPSMAARQG